MDVKDKDEDKGLLEKVRDLILAGWSLQDAAEEVLRAEGR
jgi:hypothetical protein